MLRPTHVFLTVFFLPLLLLAAVPARASVGFASDLLGGQSFFSGSTEGLDLHVDAQGTAYVLFDATDFEESALILGIRRPGGWTRERIRGGADGLSFGECDMLVDRDGTIHVAARVGPGRLEYYRRHDGVWDRQIVEQDSLSNANPKVLRDENGQLLLVAYDSSNDRLFRFVPQGNGWSAPQSFLSGYVFEYAPLAQSRDYFLSAPSSVFLLRQSTSATTTTTSLHDAAFEARGTPGFDLDASDNPHVVGMTFDPGTGEYVPFYFYGGDTTYFDRILGNFGLVAARVCVDGRGRVHAFFSNFGSSTESGLRYQRLEDGAWTSQELPGRFDPIAADVDGFGNPFLITQGRDNIFFDHAGLFLDRPVGGEVLVAGQPVDVDWDGVGEVAIELSTDGGSSWQTLASGVSGGSASVVLPRVETDEARMRVVRHEPHTVSTSPASFTIVASPDAVWTPSVLDTASDETQVDLEIAPDGTAHAVWIDPVSQVLSYGVSEQGTWNTEVVDASNEAFGRPMLALTADGTPVVVYAEQAGGTLRVGRRLSGSWSFDDVPEGADVATEFDVLVTADGTTHVAWYDEDLQRLRHSEQSAPGGPWSTSNVGTGQAGWGRGFDLETDGTDLWIAFNDDSSGSGLYIAQRPVAGGVWSTTFDTLGQTEARDPELEIDGEGTRHVLFRQPIGPQPTQIVYGRYGFGGWALERLPGAFDPDERPLDFAVDDDGNVAALINDVGRLWFVRRTGAGQWTRIDLGDQIGVDAVPAIDLGPDQQPRIVRPESQSGRLVDLFRGLELVNPGAGDVWPVGSVRSVQWFGPGAVDLELSIDGGASWSALATGVEGGTHDVQVPQVPTRFARLRVVRTAPASVVEMPGLFSIESSIALLNLSATPGSEGVALQWRSDPGPEDLLGYTVERARDADWITLASGLSQAQYVDSEGGAGDRYRVQATNGLGQSIVLGETRVDASFSLRVWPLPAAGGPVNVAFDPGRVRGASEVVVFDVRGRRVRSLFAGDAGRGITTLAWDGTDTEGRRVASGTYFVMLRSPGVNETRKVLISR